MLSISFLSAFVLCTIVWLFQSADAALTSSQKAAFSTPIGTEGNFYMVDTNVSIYGNKTEKMKVPITPKLLTMPGCLPSFRIGIAIDGIPFHSPYNGNGINTVLGLSNGSFKIDSDNCGLTKHDGCQYYRTLPSCLLKSNMTNQVLGIALDGFLIYGPQNGSGADLTSTDLDECHGMMGPDNVYRYVITEDFPYVLGCFKGEIHLPPPPKKPDHDKDDKDDKDDSSEEMATQPPPGENSTVGSMTMYTKPPSSLDDDDDDDDDKPMPPPCFFANVTRPTGSKDLNSGTINNRTPSGGGGTSAATHDTCMPALLAFALWVVAGIIAL